MALQQNIDDDYWLKHLGINFEKKIETEKRITDVNSNKVHSNEEKIKYEQLQDVEHQGVNKIIKNIE